MTILKNKYTKQIEELAPAMGTLYVTQGVARNGRKSEASSVCVCMCMKS